MKNMRRSIVGSALLAFVASLAVSVGSAQASPPGSERSDGTEAPLSSVLGTGRLHGISFNVCDQVGQTYCASPSTAKATHIKGILNSWSAQVASFQEMCRTTFDSLRSQLGYGSWDGEFYRTISAPEGRCGSNRDWGVAIFVKASIFSNVYEVKLYDVGEDRVLFCGNATHFSGFRLCTTHLDQSGPPQQVQDVADSSLYWILDRDAAYILGGDFNIDVSYGTTCSEADRMAPMYYGGFGLEGLSCGPGTNYLYEADRYTSSGDGDYDEDTFDSPLWKVDFMFFNTQRFYNDYGGDAVTSTYSDHRYLKSAMTIHD